MDPLSGFLIALAAKLAARALEEILAALPRSLRRSIQDDPKQKAALGIALKTGLEAALKDMKPPDHYRAERYAALLEHFLKVPETAEELAKLVDLHNVTEDPNAIVNIPHLEDLFRRSYAVDQTPDAYEGLNFPAAIRAFVQAYVDAVKRQPDRLPWINTAYLDAMLDRLGILPGMAEDLRAIRKAVTGETTKEQALRAYLEWVRRKCCYLPLRGVDIGASDPTTQQCSFELAKVYIYLDTKERVELDKKEKKRAEHRIWEERDTRPLGALEAAIANPRLVLLGDPGSGKSTFLGHLALCLASHHLEPDGGWLDRLPGWPQGQVKFVPISITLRDFARWMATGNMKIETRALWDFIVERLKTEMLEAAAEPLFRALKNEQAVLLFDGLDEVPSAEQRIMVRDSVAAFVGHYDKCRVILTCRTLSYQIPGWQLPNVPAFEVAPFDERKIGNFVEAWYAELSRLGAVRPEDVGGFARRLREAVRRPDLWRLAPNPLLLTVMALVHTHKGRLPEARAMLYEETVDILLWRWEQLKAGGEEGQPRLRQLLLEVGRGDVDLKRTLWELAFQAHSEGGTGDKDALADIGELDLVKALARLHPKDDWQWAKSVAEQMKERAGLLLEREPGLFTFPHRTFQEYLAGAHLAAQGKFSLQAKKLIEEGAFWREVILLAVGRLVFLSVDMDKPLALVGELCPEPAVDDDLGWRRTWLAGDALVEMGLNRVHDSSLGKDLAPRVRQRLTALVSEGKLSPVERAAAGRTLAHLGDPRTGVGVEPQSGLPDILWCEVLAGLFCMGSDKEKDREAHDDELPQRKIKLPTFYISRYPVTNSQFEAFVQAGGYKERRYWIEAEAAGQWKAGKVRRRTSLLREGGPEEKEEFDDNPLDFGHPFNLPNHPVVGISWYEALAFSRWLNEQFKVGVLKFQFWRDNKLETIPLELEAWEIRLPKEEEWEKSARGTDGRIYPWGSEPDPNMANYLYTGIGATSAVGCFPLVEGPYGALDMSGNVWEWCQTKWRENYRQPADESLEGTGLRVVRGGSWFYDPRFVRCADRGRVVPGYRNDFLGFRVVVSPGSP